MQQVRNNYIDGAWRPAEHCSESYNPSDTSELIGRYAIAGTADVRDAVEAARKAFADWKETSPQQRFDILDRAADKIAGRTQDLATLLSREEGKTLPEAAAEVTKAAHTFKYFAGEAVRLAGSSLRSVRKAVDVDVRREAVGVVGLITPWNFPFSIPAWKSAPALAYGNCVILKPSELTNAIAWELASILHDAGIPRGVFQMLMGGGDVGAALVSNRDVDAVSFTGSGAVGAMIAAQVVGRGAKLQLELGGKNPLVVADDADLDKAVDAAVRGAFYSTGQRCTASSRIIVDATVHDGFVERLVERTARLRVGHALDSASDIGPLVSAAQLQRVSRYAEAAPSDGARHAFGGRVLAAPANGYYFEPAIFLDGTMHQNINREEVFGPIVSVFKASDFEDAVRLANATEFGLSAGIFTSSHAKARAFIRASNSGMVMVNLPTVGSDYHVPFGGRGASAYGPKEMGLGAIEFFTQTKTAYIAD
ncbi:MAG TPA: aldehyde dehydrogenase family protein [Mesorhizobium sp.]|jgi:aldehyde dehydrogenase (NAD+)|uniref:aldehyde dehydrogenase family protein n=1 Tax=Mesorhizobium sp. TaxID=1871066 RepID=UPI002DDCCA41|nr:aldehyde dehydrogenase family protein [Mesorhizobium sp.]HEV2506960.1 aldehyde dehydrogenase family protein [Mesorhizobium sp.]